MRRRTSVRFDVRLAARFARLALGCVTREYPVHPAHGHYARRELRPPRDFHPAFYGCFDWHSSMPPAQSPGQGVTPSVEPDLTPTMRRVLAAHLSERNLRAEARYLDAHPSFERPYGWAWFLRLACELPEARALDPLARSIEERYVEWLPKQSQPIRSGTHANTAFGLALALDYARRFGLAFQLSDDLIDAEGDAATVGKRTGKDAGRGKATLVGERGIAAAREHLVDLVAQAEGALLPFGAKAAMLVSAVRFLATRKH